MGEFQDDLKFQSLEMDFLWDDSKITHSLNILKRNRLQGWLHSRMSLCLSRLSHPSDMLWLHPAWMVKGHVWWQCWELQFQHICRVPDLEKAILDVIYLHRYKRSRMKYFAKLIWLLMQQNYDHVKEKRWGNINHKLQYVFLKNKSGRYYYGQTT